MMSGTGCYFNSLLMGNAVEVDEGSLGGVVDESETRTALRWSNDSNWGSRMDYLMVSKSAVNLRRMRMLRCLLSKKRRRSIVTFWRTFQSNVLNNN